MAAASVIARGVEPAAGAQQHVALRGSRRPPCGCWRRARRLAHGERVAVALGVLLDDDGVGALRARGAPVKMRTASPAPTAAGEGPPGAPRRSRASVGRHRRDVGGAHRVAVHGGGIERRLRQASRPRARPARGRRRRAGRRSRRRSASTPSRMRAQRLVDGEQRHGSRALLGAARSRPSGRRSSRAGGCPRCSCLCRRPSACRRWSGRRPTRRSAPPSRRRSGRRPSPRP